MNGLLVKSKLNACKEKPLLMEKKNNINMNTMYSADISFMVAQDIKRKSKLVPQYTFTWIEILVIFISMGTFIADIVTGIN